MVNDIKNSQLGKKTNYIFTYDNSLLHPISRQINRKLLSINNIPFSGFDIWNAYEFSWLQNNGKPQVAIISLAIPCDSPYLIESKSLKLYLNSFSNTHFTSKQDIKDIITTDLNKVLQSSINLDIMNVDDQKMFTTSPIGQCLDQLDISCDEYHPNKSLLITKDNWTKKSVYSHLLKSNCPITNQPDWASISISYEGKEIIAQNLLKYIVSFRNHQEFHEHCVEQIFVDILSQCSPKYLTVSANYTRRGGIDINPIRTNINDSYKFKRFIRQ